MSDIKSIFELDENVPIKEFMETFVREYDGHWLPSDYELTIARLDGYRMGLGKCEESNLISSSITLLRDAKQILEAIKRLSNWKCKQ